MSMKVNQKQVSVWDARDLPTHNILLSVIWRHKSFQVDHLHDTHQQKMIQIYNTKKYKYITLTV